MRYRIQFPAWLGAFVVLAMVSPGCSCGGDDSASSATAGVGGAGGAGGDGGGTTSTTTSAGGAGGEGGAVPGGGPATETVSAGEVSSSPSYRMVYTFGQPTQNQGKTTSPGYRMQGGLVGANGSLP